MQAKNSVWPWWWGGLYSLWYNYLKFGLSRSWRPAELLRKVGPKVRVNWVRRPDLLVRRPLPMKALISGAY